MQQIFHLLKSSSRRPRPEQYRAESGVAMIEFAIVFPFLFLFIVAIWDVGRALSETMTASRIVYEGVRFAASVPGLETPTTVADNIVKGETTGLVNAVVPVNLSNHKRIRDRMSQILTRYNIPFDDATVSTMVVKDNSSAVPKFTVTVALQLKFRSHFPLLDQLIQNVGAVTSGPYMFSN